MTDEELKQLEEDVTRRVMARITKKSPIDSNGFTGPLGEVRQKYMKSIWKHNRRVCGPIDEMFGPFDGNKLWIAINQVAKILVGQNYINRLTIEQERDYAEIVEWLCEYSLNNDKRGDNNE